MAAPGSVVAGVKVPDGDPGALRGIAGKFSGSAQAVGRVKGQLASAQGQVGSWTGRAAEGFYSTCETNEGAAGAMVGAFHAAARAVSRYAHELEAAQHEAAHLQRQAQAAETTMHTAQAAIAHALAAGHHAPATASADLSTAQGDLTTIHGRAAALLRHVEAAGRTAAGEVHAATRTIPRWTAPPPPPAPPEPEHHSFFSLHTLETAGNGIADGATAVAGATVNTTGGFTHGFSFGLVGWGDPESTAYEAGNVASYVPVNPASAVRDLAKVGARVVIRRSFRLGGDEVRTVAGKLPRNSHLAGGMHPYRERNPALGAQFPQGVPFKRTGFPDFRQYSERTVKVKRLTGDHGVDKKLANEKAGLPKKPAGFAWHHGEDGRTMQLVPHDLHTAVGHTGGAEILRAHEQPFPMNPLGPFEPRTRVSPPLAAWSVGRLGLQAEGMDPHP